MCKRIKGCFKKRIRGKILAISGVENFYPLIDKEFAEFIQTSYPEVDMQNLPFDDATFDMVISDQIIEHLENPMRAIHESWRVLKEGGIVILTTCFINYIHPCPKDFWRFSPDALKYLCNNFSEILQCEGWGNRVAILLCFYDKFRFMNIPESKLSIRRKIATINEKRYPIVTWIVARK